MDDKEDASRQQVPSLKGLCPFCLSELDVHFDVKHRPYWRCWRCEVRSFATKTAFRNLKESGWIWKDEQPHEAIENWLDGMMQKLGLRKGKQ
jgi:hypothetical protein